MRIDNPTGSIASLTGSFTGSFYGDGLGLINIESASYAETAANAISASYAVSSSHEIVTEVSSSYAETATSSSYALTASYALNGGSGGGGGSADYSPYQTGSSDSNILPKEGSNCCVMGSYSSILGGDRNEIPNQSYTSIVGGLCNIITSSNSNSRGNFIGGGSRNTMNNTFLCRNSILGGCLNKICGYENASNQNGALTTQNVIGGGCKNIISGSVVNSIIGSGLDNLICGCINSPAYAFIGSGNCNIIKGCTHYGNSIVGGCKNTIDPSFNTSPSCRSSVNHSAILGGINNTASACESYIIGGCENFAKHECSFIIGTNLTTDKICYTFMNNADVAGTVCASIFNGSFVGDGSGLTGIPGGGVTFDYTDSDTDENLILGESLTLGIYNDKNTALGYLAYADNDSGGENTFIGYAAGRYNSGGQFSGLANTSVGYRALMGVNGQTTGFRNTAVGHDAAYLITTGCDNTAIGQNALRQITIGSCNTSTGYQSGHCTTGGCNNSFYGKSAGYGVTGDHNTYIGSQTGRCSSNQFTGDNNTTIGYEAKPSSLSVSNEITIGNTNITSLRIPGLQSGASDGNVLTYSSTSGDITLQTPSGGGGTIYNSTVRYVAYDSTQLVEILSTGTMYSGLSWSRSGATITITSTAHGLSNGDYVVVRNMGDTDYVYGAISSVTTDSFQITNAVSSGDTSGTAGAYIPAADATSVTDSAATIGSPTVGDIQIISIKVHFGNFKSGNTFNLTMPTSLTNGAGGNTSTATMNPPIVGVWDLSSGAFNASGLVSVWGGTGSAGSYNVFQVGGINQLIDGMIKFTF